MAVLALIHSEALAAGAICPGESPAHETFNAFWAEVDRSYALFDIRLPHANWDELGRNACSDVSADDDQEALSGVLLGLARELDDGHVMLTAEHLDFEEDAQVSQYPHDDAVDEVERVIEERYLDGKLSRAAEGCVAWGRVGDVGYLSISGMDELTSHGDDEDRDVAAAEKAVTAALRDLRGSSGLVVDVRANGGGWDSVSLAIARRFAGSRSVAWSKQRRAGPKHDDFGEWEYTYVEDATEDAFTGPVVLLTSGGTVSAAETFALAMRVRDAVTILGERSSGYFSDMIDSELPNGWLLDLSGERYRAADGEIYEGRGVPVDEPVAFDASALAKGIDVMFEAALTRLGVGLAADWAAGSVEDPES